MNTPSPRPISPSHRERQRTRTRVDILEAVITVFADDGGSGPVIEQIATAAGLSRATLYAHFPGGVDDLTQAAYDRLSLQFVDQTDAQLRGRTDWRERIMAHAEVMTEWATDPHRGVFYNVVGPKVVDSSAHIGTGSTSTRTLVRTELTRAKDLGEVPSTLDADAVSSMLTTCVRTIGVDVARDPERCDAYLAAFRTVLRGLGANPVPRT